MKLKLVIFICLLFSICIEGQKETLKFKQLSLEDGLSQSSVSSILKDSRDFMWFGTEDGLNKFDGNNFTIYQYKSNDKESISSSYINTIIEQEDGFLWIGTKNGLNYFNPNTEKFTRYLERTETSDILANHHINTLFFTKKKQLLVGTAAGLNLFDPNTKSFIYFPKISSERYNVVSVVQDTEGYLWVLSSLGLEKMKLTGNSLESISLNKSITTANINTTLLDSPNLYVGTERGLVQLDLKTQESKMIKFYREDQSEDRRNNIQAVVRGEKNKLWVVSNIGGLIDFNIKTGDFGIITHDPYNRLSLNINILRTTYLDDSNILWVGTMGGGINKHDPNQFKFHHYKHEPGNKNSISNNSVRAIFVDSENDLWVGTHGGLNRLNVETGLVKVYTYNEINPISVSSNLVRSLVEDSTGIIWAGTWHDGLNSFNKKTGRFTRYFSFPNTKDSIGGVRALEIDRDDNVWIGGKGLWKFNPKTKHYTADFFDSARNNLNTTVISSLYFDTKERLWIGTYTKGLNYLDPNSNIVVQYLNDTKDSLSISHNHVTSIAQDQKGFIWAGTYGGGLNVLNTFTGNFKRYNSSNGLLNDVIYGVLIDEFNNVWFTSNAGLTKFDQKTNQFRHFSVDNGIQSEEFNAGAYYKSDNGEFFFGGINGFNAFYPNTIDQQQKIARIVFTDFELLDQKKTPNSSVLDKHISNAEHIKLNYNQNSFTLTFSELNYSDNADNIYQYLLEGLERKWHDTSRERQITIGNLKPGKYTLHVRAYGELTKKTSINIEVLTPFWQSRWAYVFYACCFGFLIFLFYMNNLKTKRLRSYFELKIKNWENDRSLQTENNYTLSLKEVAITPMNQKFLERVIKIVEEHLEDSSFDVEKFADEMFMSRSQLHRKLKNLTGYTTTEFTRLIRLKRAAQLLASNSGNVSQVAYQVGFENIGYFSKCFREMFGKPPSKYHI